MFLVSGADSVRPEVVEAAWLDFVAKSMCLGTDEERPISSSRADLPDHARADSDQLEAFPELMAERNGAVNSSS